MHVVVAALLVITAADGDVYERARDAFREGVGHVEAGRLEAAADAFERSLELRDSRVVRYNLGVTCHRLKRLECARRELVRYLEDPEAAIDDKFELAQKLMFEIDPQAGLLVLDVAPGVESTTVDGAWNDRRRMVIPAGRHTVRASRTGFEDEETEVVVERGIRASVWVAAPSRNLPPDPPPAVAPPSAVPPPPPQPPPPVAPVEPIVTERSTPVTKTWWFWTAIGVVVASAAVGVVVVASGAPEPDGGSLGFVETGLRGRDAP